MVRVTKFGWRDDGPIQDVAATRDWFGADDPDPPAKRRPVRRRPRSRTSPIDHRQSRNPPPEDAVPRAA
jgi:hypothetical protein